MSVFFRLFGARFSEFSPQGTPSVCHGRQLPLHRGAMDSRCPPGVDRLVFGLIGRRRFGGRRELRSPLSSHRNVFSKHPGVPVGLFSDSAPTHLRCAGVPVGLFGKPKRSSFSRVRGLHQAILWPLLQNARPSAALRPAKGSRG